MNGHEAEVAAEIRRLAREQGSRQAPFGDEEELAAQLDSLQLLALVTAVEDRYRIVLTPDDAAGTRSLADLARLVVRRVEAEGRGEGT
ncbi:MAG: acyl carrier protein [Deltaproteobacteria bacterium]|nr:acyl carrier protein [Deltaproteobacteria bacterium]